jgi:hypothetical protein
LPPAFVAANLWVAPSACVDLLCRFGFITVLFVRPKITEWGLRLFGRSVHPELFEVCGTRKIEREQYTLQVSLTTSGHWWSLRLPQGILTEVCASRHQLLPQGDSLLSQKIEADHHVNCSERPGWSWQSHVQCEIAGPSLFLAIRQQFDHQPEFEGLAHRFETSGRFAIGGVSYVNIQAFRRHLQIRAFHTFPDSFTVIKTNSTIHLQDDRS